MLKLLGDENLFIRDIIADSNKLERLSIKAIDNYILHLKTNNIYDKKKVERYYREISKSIILEVAKTDILIEKAKLYISKL